VLFFFISSSFAFAGIGEALALPTVDEAFDAFMSKYHRSYKDHKELAMRKANFARNWKLVDSTNSKNGLPWRANINKFADRSEAELATLRGWKSKVRPGQSSALSKSASAAHLLSTTVSAVDLPQEHSWSNLTSVQEVQDQGGCGSCWAFASAAVLRAHSEIWLKDPRKFSVQQIISCTKNPKECGGTGGCQGATAELAMDYVFQNGCKTEKQLPYTQQEDQSSCPHSLVQQSDEPMAVGTGGASVGMVGWTKLPENKLHPLKVALVTKGPVAVSISAGQSWNQYDAGVLDDCPKDAIIDHAVVLFAYGETKKPSLVGDDSVAPAGLKYWQLQNSWGFDWGEKGYIRMLRHEDDFEETKQCGTDNDPQIGSGCNGGPPTVPVCGMCGILYDTVIPHFEDRRSSATVKRSSSFLQPY